MMNTILLNLIDQIEIPIVLISLWIQIRLTLLNVFAFIILLLYFYDNSKNLLLNQNIKMMTYL